LSVSIIIPVFNAASTLAKTVGSVLDQTYSEIQIIAIDNNSDDASLDILRKLSEAYPGKLTIGECPKQGACPARNVGLRLTNADWIQFLDADDTFANNKISYQLKRVSPDTQWVIGGYSIVSPGQEDMVNIPHEDPWKGLVYQYRIGCTHANMYRREALEAVGGWDESLPDNTDPNLHFELLKSGLKYQIIPEVLSFYHQHSSPNRLSTRAPIAGNLRRIDLLERVNDYLRDNQPQYWQAEKNYFLAALLRALRILATHDLGKATSQFKRLHNAGKIALDLPNQPIISQKLLSTYRIAGFHTIEAIRLRSTNFLPMAFKNWLKR
jgi:glycosyltransferase involved in cell wall biosynthesis